MEVNVIIVWFILELMVCVMYLNSWTWMPLKKMESNCMLLAVIHVMDTIFQSDDVLISYKDALNWINGIKQHFYIHSEENCLRNIAYPYSPCEISEWCIGVHALVRVFNRLQMCSGSVSSSTVCLFDCVRGVSGPQGLQQTPSPNKFSFIKVTLTLP